MLRLLLAIAIVAPQLYAQWFPLPPAPEPANSLAFATTGRGYMFGLYYDSEDEEEKLYAFGFSPLAWTAEDDLDALPDVPSTADFVYQLNNGNGDGLWVVSGPTLYWYEFDEVSGPEGTWYEEEIAEFSASTGTVLVYRPTRYYSPFHPVAGWLYCAPGNGSLEWWCKPVPGTPDQAVDGVFPPDGSVIADRTPRFVWPDASGGVTLAHRLQASADPSFQLGAMLIDVTVPSTSYQTPDSEFLPDGMVYWRTAFETEAGWDDWTGPRAFELQHDWVRKAPCLAGVFGASGGCYSFDGVDEYIYLFPTPSEPTSLTWMHCYLPNDDRWEYCAMRQERDMGNT